MDNQIIDGVLHIDAFLSVTIGIVVLFVGRRLNYKINFLREISIPEPVTGGIVFSILFLLVYLASDLEVLFDLKARDILLVYFFITIGINARFKDLISGGLPLIILLIATIAYMVIQNLTGITIANLFGLDSAIGMLGGSVSLIGGHGTAIAWSPQIAEQYGVPNAMEIGIACATFGLILASLMGGPIANFLIRRYKLEPTKEEIQENKENDGTVIGSEESREDTITSFDFLDAIFAIHICGIVGYIVYEALIEAGIKLPLFVPCLLVAILISNLIPSNFPRLSGTRWPSRTPAIALIADISLGTFLAMSLMSMQLWTLVDLAGPIITILGAQFLIAILINVFIIFRIMGKNYDAAVVCSGFGGISLGSTPTAMANMSAVSKRYGPSQLAFIIVPLVCAFFIDIANAIMIPYFLQNF